MKYKLIIDKSAEEEVIAIVHSPSMLTDEIENLVCRFSGADSVMGYKDDEMRKIPFESIECITVMDRKIIAIDRESNHYRIQERLRDLESILPSYFIKINNSTLANEHCILKFNATFNGGIDAVFKCGYKDYVSRRCFAQIKRRYEKI